MEKLLARVRACRKFKVRLPLGLRRVLPASKGAQIIIIGQAPGTKAQGSGIEWKDASGDKLRE
jgi:uracil-DNA glycosylase